MYVICQWCTTSGPRGTSGLQRVVIRPAISRRKKHQKCDMKLYALHIIAHLFLVNLHTCFLDFEQVAQCRLKNVAHQCVRPIQKKFWNASRSHSFYCNILASGSLLVELNWRTVYQLLCLNIYQFDNYRNLGLLELIAHYIGTSMSNAETYNQAIGSPPNRLYRLS